MIAVWTEQIVYKWIGEFAANIYTVKQVIWARRQTWSREGRGGREGLGRRTVGLLQSKTLKEKKKWINPKEIKLRAASGCPPRWSWQRDPSSSGGGCLRSDASAYRREITLSSPDPAERGRRALLPGGEMKDMDTLPKPCRGRQRHPEGTGGFSGDTN